MVDRAWRLKPQVAALCSYNSATCAKWAIARGRVELDWFDDTST